MKAPIAIKSLLAALLISTAQAAPEALTLRHTLAVTPEIKKAFETSDAIEIRSMTGTAAKFQTGGTYRVVGTCRQHTLKNLLVQHAVG